VRMRVFLFLSYFAGQVPKVEFCFYSLEFRQGRPTDGFAHATFATMVNAHTWGFRGVRVVYKGWSTPAAE